MQPSLSNFLAHLLKLLLIAISGNVNLHYMEIFPHAMSQWCYEHFWRYILNTYICIYMKFFVNVMCKIFFGAMNLFWAFCVALSRAGICILKFHECFFWSRSRVHDHNYKDIRRRELLFFILSRKSRTCAALVL